MIEEMRRRIKFGYRNPIGLALLLASVLLAIDLRWLRALAAWSHLASWVMVLGMVAYLATIATAKPVASEIQKVRAIRQSMATRIRQLRATQKTDEESGLVRILAEAVRELDQQIVPTLQEVIVRHQALHDQLNRYQRQELPLPDGEVMERLRMIYLNQMEAVAACVQQAANADAALLALTAEGDEAKAVREARRWANALLDTQAGLAEALRM